MPSRKKNIRRSSLSEIDVEQIVKYLKFIGAMSGALLIIAILGFSFAVKEPATVVVYTMVIVINIVVLMASLIGPKYLIKKAKVSKEG